MATASLLSASKLSSTSSSSSSDDSHHDVHPLRSCNPSKNNKDFLFEQPEGGAKNPSTSSSSMPKRLPHISKSKPLLSSSDSDSQPEEPRPKSKNSSIPPTTSTGGGGSGSVPAAISAKRRPSAPEAIVKSADGVKKMERSNSTLLKKRKESSSSSKTSAGIGGKLSTRGSEKMENIFGHFSDDSDDVTKAPPTTTSTSSQSHPSHPSHPSKLQVSLVYSSDSDVPVAKATPATTVTPATVTVKQEKPETTSPLPTTEKRKKKSKESRSRDHKKSGSDKDPSGHKNRSSENHSETEDLLEAGRALESKLLEESSVVAFSAAPAKELEAKAHPSVQLPASGMSEHKKKKKKSKKAHRDPSPPAFKTEAADATAAAPTPSATAATIPVVIKTEPVDPEASAPASAVLLPSPKSKTAVKSADSADIQLSMPSLWETGSVGGATPSAVATVAAAAETPSAPSAPSAAPPAAVVVVVAAAAAAAAAEDKARPVIWKQETEDAVAGLLLETFDDFKTETLDEEPVDPVPVPTEEMVPNEEALKAIQSLQCEDDLDLSGEMIIDSEAGTSSEAEATPYSAPEATSSSSTASASATTKTSSTSKPVVETAPTPPPSPPELLIDETRCHPDNDPAGSVKEEKPPKTPEINMKSPRTPDLEMDVSRGPPTPELPAATPPFANPNSNPGVAAVKQPQQQHKNAPEEINYIQSPPKRGRKPTGVIRSRRGRGRPSGTSRGVSESSLEGHDADVYEFNDAEEAEVPAVVSTPLAEIAEPKTILHDVDTVPSGIAHTTVKQHSELPAPSASHLLLDYVPSSGIQTPRKPEAEHLQPTTAAYKDHHRMTTIDDTIENVVRGHYSGEKLPVQLPHSVIDIQFNYNFVFFNSI